MVFLIPPQFQVRKLVAFSLAPQTLVVYQGQWEISLKSSGGELVAGSSGLSLERDLDRGKGLWGFWGGACH